MQATQSTKRGVTFEKLRADMQQLHEKAGQVRAILALCEAGYFSLLESSGPEEEPDTLEASIRGALDTSLSLVGKMAASLETGLDLCRISLRHYGDQEGAFKGLNSYEDEILKKALECVRCPDEASIKLARQIDALWLSHQPPGGAQ